MFGKSILSSLLFLVFVNCYPVDNPRDPFANLSKPFTPKGGIGTSNTTVPYYHPLSDFDYQSLLLSLNQEYIELDLFNYGLAKFSQKDFEEAGLNSADRELIHFMAIQEVGHAELISNMLGESAPTRCNYTYPFETVPEFISFAQKLTRWGESGVYGFLSHLDSRGAASLLLQSITTEARQQFVFRQFQGLNPMPYDFIVGVPQSFLWTLLAPYITSCPSTNPRIEFSNFPALNILNGPDALSNSTGARPAISTVNNTLTKPGRRIQFSWEDPGVPVGWVPVENTTKIGYTNAGNYNGSTTDVFNGSSVISTDSGNKSTGNKSVGNKSASKKLYTTSILAKGPAKYAAWISQLNTTYTPLHDVKSDNTAWTLQPNSSVFPQSNSTIVNGTAFVALVDEAIPLTPFNLTQINEHVVAGPALYQAG